MKVILLTFLLCGCSITIYYENKSEHHFIETAKPLMGLHERQDRSTLQDFLGVDPVRVEWCAAFVNSVLVELDMPGSGKFHRYPLLARSFLNWGMPISKEDIEIGDIVVFSRGNTGWQGHVGFFYGSFIDNNGVEYWNILGGNQSNSISIAPYRADRSIGIRRWVEVENPQPETYTVSSGRNHRF